MFFTAGNFDAAFFLMTASSPVSILLLTSFVGDLKTSTSVCFSLAGLPAVLGAGLVLMGDRRLSTRDSRLTFNFSSMGGSLGLPLRTTGLLSTFSAAFGLGVLPLKKINDNKTMIWNANGHQARFIKIAVLLSVLQLQHNLEVRVENIPNLVLPVVFFTSWLAALVGAPLTSPPETVVAGFLVPTSGDLNKTVLIGSGWMFLVFSLAFFPLFLIALASSFFLREMDLLR